jgi:dTMP kinase
MQAETELMLMAASRIEHVAQVIEPALARGDWVLCDRFLDASVAYQGGGRELGQPLVEQLHQLMGMTLQPDLTLLLDMPVADGLARMAERGAPDRIEQETLVFFERARAAYGQRAREDSSRVAVINAGQPLLAVQAMIDNALEPLLLSHNIA